MSLRVKLKTDECCILSSALSEATERVSVLEAERALDEARAGHQAEEIQRLEEVIDL